MKKGVKRKADTTTPMGSSFEGGYTTPTIDQQSGPKPAKISTRRESGRQKKVQLKTIHNVQKLACNTDFFVLIKNVLFLSGE